MTEKQLPPPGTRPLMISMREMDTLGLKTGPGLKDTIDYKVFDKQTILDEIAKIGFMCPFHEHRAEIAKLEIPELLLVADRDELYGENWLLCVRQEGYQAQMAIITQRQQGLEAAEADSKSETKEEDEMLSIIYEDKPIIARPWESSTSEDTHETVRMLSIHQSRPLITMTVTRHAKEFNADYKFSDRDADQCFVECRQHKDPNYDLTRMEQDVGLQGIPELIDNATQTSWFRAVNSALQYEPIKFANDLREREMQSTRMQHFLATVLPRMEEALQQNETLDIVLDPLAILAEEEMAAGGQHKSESNIKELRTFTDLIYSKNKTLPSIDWHPKKSGVVAVAAATNSSFSKRADATDKVDGSYVLMWNFADLIHPQLMMEAPQDVMAVRFNPTQPGIVAAGLFNGQVCVWDISKAEGQVAKKKTKSSGHHRTADSTKDEPQKAMPPVKPIYISYIDLSHRRPVADLQWLPPGLEINNRGHLTPSQDQLTHQFITIAGDGQVCFWDLRFKDPKYRMLNHGRIKQDKTMQKAAKDGKEIPPEVLFTPLYSITLTKVDGAGELGLKCITIERTKDDQPSSRFFCGTEEGELMLADWRPRASKDDDNSSSNNNEDSVEYVQWACHDHFRTTTSLSRSPFFPYILLTVSESNFHIWNVNHSGSPSTNTPIFISPFSLAPLTCGCFSPTRPGVIYIGKADGVLEVWDLLDQSHRPSFSSSIAACSLTTLEFRPAGPVNTTQAATSSATTSAAMSGPGVKPNNNAMTTNVPLQQAPKQQLLAVGDINGNLHILEVPRTLSRGSTGERGVIESYFKREIVRVKAVLEYADAGARAMNVALNGQAPPPPTTAATSTKPANSNAEDDLFLKLEKEFKVELGIDDHYIEQLLHKAA
ncbi:hypothetical protein LEN26_006346 [Aphanomyces euteiches]|nr:hypothetical protein AeMF1_003080 [Aphanomyces euteiches]KAH9135830.1 hypothetical protein LEN26_006346 [Aphanomyces euteiches]KAH9191115.1 hypothetical protein AeNC1_006911 [Aphanomyces euteiches]